MKKNILSVSILISGILISGAIIGFADAQTEPLLQPQEQKMPGDIQYPIPELGNCKSKSDCKIFCDNSKNSNACLAFAEKRNLMSPEELVNAKKFQENGMVGPGSCKGQAACEQYCGNSTHLEECVTFAQKNGMMSEQELQDSQKVLTAIKNGIKPPACSGPKQCETYCSSSLHMEECMTFSLAAGLVPDNQKEQMQKTLDAVKQGIKPPACRGKEECDKYCGTHMEECMTFSLAAGMVPDNQKEQMQKTLDAFKQGIKPPACQPNPPSQSDQPNKPGQPSQQNQASQSSQSGQGLQACDQYCAEPSHVEECVKFSVAIGNMTEQQAQSAIKNGNKGPGGCIGKDACDTFCNNPDNEETCFNFAKDNGMISEEDSQKMQEGQQKMKDSFSSIPPEVLDCISSSLGADVVEKMKTGSVIGRKSGDSINKCFQKSGVEERRPNQDQNGQDQRNQNQQNQQIEPWKDMCKPDENGNPTALACVDGSGKFVTSAKVGSDGKPVCPTGSTAKCGNYQQQNQQGQSGNKFQPGPGNVNSGGQQMPQQAGPGGCKGPEECQKYCASNPEVCKNFQPQQNQGQPNQPGQMQQQQQQQPQFNQDGQPQQNQPNQFNPLNQLNQLNPLNQPGQQQPGQMQPQSGQQPMEQQQNPPLPPPSSFLQGTQGFLANILDALK